MNKEKIAEYKKKWAEKNKEKLVANRKIYYINNKEKAIERATIFNKSDKRKEWKERAKEQNSEYGKKYWQKTKDKKVHLKLYNITLDDYQQMYTIQNGRCSICNILEIESGIVLNVDHCHTTGKVRGLLCRNCNTSLGLLEDNIYIIKNLIKYLSNV